MVVIGGGTGTYTVLNGLKEYQQQLDLSAVVTMADSGGSTGRLRDEFGYLPVGDVRMALVALARDIDEHEELVRQLFLYRFEKGDGLSGHNFGNLLLVVLTELLGSETAAIQAAARMLQVRGNIVPVTNKKIDLVATYDDGVTVTGEHEIDEPTTDREKRKITDLSVTPQVEISKAAEATIAEADLIILGPGDLYTSVLANCVVKGVAEAIRNATAKVVYVSNLMTKLGQTSDMGVAEHVSELEKYVGRVPDYVLVNTSSFPADLVAKYAEDEEYPVVANYQANEGEVIAVDLLATESVKTPRGDVLKRSLIRHDSQKLAQQLIKLL